nr:MAG TPA: hypothetical protein [Caudoviricetes sp.]
MRKLFLDFVLNCHNLNDIPIDNYSALLYILLNCAGTYL